MTLKVTVESTKTRKGPFVFTFKVEDEEAVMDAIAGANAVKSVYDLLQLLRGSS